MMIDIVRLLKMYLEKLDFRPLKTPFVSALNGELVLDGPAAKTYCCVILMDLYTIQRLCLIWQIMTLL